MITGQIKRGGSLTGSVKQSGSLATEIFWVTYGTTTAEEINQAITEQKVCVMSRDNSFYYLIRYTATEYFFASFDTTGEKIKYYRFYNNSWYYNTVTYQEALTFDTTPKQFSNNPVRSYGIWNAIQAAKTTVDAALSATSENPVQNRSVYEALATKADVSSVEPFVQDAVDEWMETYAPTIGTLSNAAKHALLNCFAHVAWIDNQGQSYYNALERELFPDSTLESINAVFTQGSAVIYASDSLDTLKQYLVVTATYSDSTTETITDYTLSGTLSAGTSTITVSYGGKTDTFTVNVNGIIWLYKDGDEVTNITGGWDVGTGFITNANRGTASKANDGLSFTLTNIASTGHDVALSISTHNPVNLTPYSKLVVELIIYRVNSAGTINTWAYLPSSLNTANTQSSAYGSDYSSHRVFLGNPSDIAIEAPITVENSITDQTGERYVSFNFNPYGGAVTGTYAKILKAYLVPAEE